ncbi:MAG: MBL fold metallo-hydrolase [Synergistaceae bacterium]|nr:MBL fold metallo-hydrolase [Synergistaceae bacterium]
MELLHLAGQTYCFPGRVNVGVYRKEDMVWIVDSGLDDDAGRRIARWVEGEKFTLRRIVTTHSNADHCGGNAFLRKRTGCSVAATRLEAAIIEHPFIEPLLLWSAWPFVEITNKFLQSKPSEVDHIIENTGTFDDSELEAVPLPGHFIDMIGVRTPDGVLFAADSLFSKEIIDKYSIMFVLDVGAALSTLDFLEKTEAKWFVPSHAQPTEDIRPLAEVNRAALLRVSELVLDRCGEPATREGILKTLSDRFGLSMSGTEYVLNFAVVGAHLTWLRERGLVFPAVSEGRLLWKKSA